MSSESNDGVVRGFVGRGRWLRAGVIVAVAGAIAVAVVWWWPDDLRPGWAGAEQANVVAGIVGGLAAVAGAVVAVLAWRRPRQPEPAPLWRSGLLQVGSVPSAADCYQHREVGDQLLRAVGKGKAAVLIQVVTGMGGVGKTQLAAELARELAERRRLDLLVWVNAGSGEGAIVAGYAEAAAALRLAEEGVDALRAAGRFLAWAANTRWRWLVVLDDVPAPGDLTDWWPPATSRGRVVVTTRRRDAALQAQGRALVDVDLFTADEARSYLLQVLPGHSSHDVDALAADLGYLPLALAQAAVSIRDRGWSCQQYRERLADRRRSLQELLPEDESLPDQQQATVAATWALSIEAADALHPVGLARPVLELASVLDPNGIPIGVLTTPSALGYLARATDRQVAAEDVDAALRNLHRLSLLNVDTERNSVRVHALVQRATRDMLPDQQIPLAMQAAAKGLVRVLGSEHPDTLATRGNLAVWRGEAGDVAGAVRELEGVLGDMVRVLGPDHPHTQAIRRALAHWRGSRPDNQ